MDKNLSYKNEDDLRTMYEKYQTMQDIANQFDCTTANIQYYFDKCPDCHRSTTVRLTLHPDGDVSNFQLRTERVWIGCDACEAYASAHKLHEHDRDFQ